MAEISVGDVYRSQNVDHYWITANAQVLSPAIETRQDGHNGIRPIWIYLGEVCLTIQLSGRIQLSLSAIGYRISVRLWSVRSCKCICKDVYRPH